MELFSDIPKEKAFDEAIPDKTEKPKVSVGDTLARISREKREKLETMRIRVGSIVHLRSTEQKIPLIVYIGHSEDAKRHHIDKDIVSVSPSAKLAKMLLDRVPGEVFSMPYKQGTFIELEVTDVDNMHEELS